MGNDPSKQASGELTDREIKLLKSCTKLSEEEIREFHKEFKSECPSGEMNKDQFQKFYKEIAPPEDKDGSLHEHAFAVFDKNQDGTIDFAEFVLAIAVENSDDLDGELEFVFSIMDTSGDQHISYDELKNFYSSAIKLRGTKLTDITDPNMFAASIYDKFGVDKGKKLSKQQFLEGCKNNQYLNKIFGK